MDTMLTDGVSRQKTEFPAKKPGLMEFIPKFWLVHRKKG